MAKLTRRKLIVGAAAAPLMVPIAPPAPADPVPLMARWSDLEAELPRAAIGDRKSTLPQARAMRAIDCRLRRLLVKLGRDAERIAPMPALSREGGLAKIEMPLAILESVDVEEHSWALVTAGFDDLTRLAERG